MDMSVDMSVDVESGKKATRGIVGHNVAVIVFFCLPTKGKFHAFFTRYT